MSVVARTSPRRKSRRRPGVASRKRSWLVSFGAATRLRSSHTSDSGMWRRMSTTSRAGTTEMKKQPRHPQSGPKAYASAGWTNPPMTEAIAIPSGAPVCITAANRPRIRAGKVSPTRVCPVAHSPPTPRPVITRQTASHAAPCANPHRNAPSEYTRIVQERTVFRPNRSASHPNTMPPSAVAASVVPTRSESDESERASDFLIGMSRNENSIRS